jgi:hypothetical protein
MTDSTDDATQIATLQRVGRKLASANAKRDEAMEAAKAAALEAIASGVPQAVVARELGVNRMTVRQWLDKREWNPSRK